MVTIRHALVSLFLLACCSTSAAAQFVAPPGLDWFNQLKEDADENGIIGSGDAFVLSVTQQNSLDVGGSVPMAQVTNSLVLLHSSRWDALSPAMNRIIFSGQVVPPAGSGAAPMDVPSPVFSTVFRDFDAIDFIGPGCTGSPDGIPDLHWTSSAQINSFDGQGRIQTVGLRDVMSSSNCYWGGSQEKNGLLRFLDRNSDGFAEGMYVEYDSTYGSAPGDGSGVRVVEVKRTSDAPSQANAKVSMTVDFVLKDINGDGFMDAISVPFIMTILDFFQANPLKRPKQIWAPLSQGTIQPDIDGNRQADTQFARLPLFAQAPPSGQPGRETIPTLNVWGLLALAALLSVAGMFKLGYI